MNSVAAANADGRHAAEMLRPAIRPSAQALAIAATLAPRLAPGDPAFSGDPVSSADLEPA